MTASRSEATVRHTRGPWRVIDDVDPDTKQRNRLHQIWSAEEPIIYPDGRPGTSSILIARTCFAPASTANAALIAAAPDMYEALRWLLHLHHGVSKGGGEPSDDEWQEALQAGMVALAKAEGRAIGEKAGP